MHYSWVRNLIIFLFATVLFTGSSSAASLGNERLAIYKAVQPVLNSAGSSARDSAKSKPPEKKKGKYVDGEVLVKFKSTVSASNKDKIHKKHGSTKLRDIKKLNIHHVKLKKGLTVEEAVNLYSTDPDVEFAEPNFAVSASMIPNDPFFSSSGSWSQPYSDTWGLHKLQMDLAWDITQGSGDVVVAVLDTGLDLTHPDIQENIWTNPRTTPYTGIEDGINSFADDLHGWNFIAHSNDPTDDHGHGTHVSGTIAATANNGIGLPGVSWHSKIMPLKMLGSDGYGNTSDAISSIIYAIDNGARVINCSWGSPDLSYSLRSIVDYATSSGVVVVAAAGNGGGDASTVYPAGLDRVITVAATDASDQGASWTNRGAAVKVAAPGTDILSLRAAGAGPAFDTVAEKYSRASGTSVAAPYVSGIAALLFSQHPDWRSDEVALQIVGTADDIGNPALGTGRVNALSALTRFPDRVRLQYWQNNLAGSPDGGLTPGSSYTFTVTVKSSGAPATAVVTLSTADPYITLTQDTATISALAMWGAGETTPLAFTVSPQAPVLHKVTFTATITASDGSISTGSFERWISPYLPGWPVATGYPVVHDPLLADVDGDGVSEVLVDSDKIYILKGDGTLLASWWRPNGMEGMSGLAVADLDGDGKLEVVGNSASGIYAWKTSGIALPGFPLLVPAPEDAISSVVLADLDGDGKSEIISTAYRSGKVYAWRGDGTVQPGWPVSIPAATGTVSDMLAAVADLDGDGSLEVLVPSSDGKVYAFHHDGVPVAGWPVQLDNRPAIVAVGDIKADGRVKVFVGCEGSLIYGFNGDGSGIPGWPKPGFAPALGDVDGDGELEIVADYVTTAGESVDSKIAVYRADGSYLPGWPQQKISSSLKTPLIGDIDGDGTMEIVELTLHGLYAWHADGTLVENFPVVSDPDYLSWGDTGLAMGDITGDGKVAIITGSAAGQYNVRAFNLPYAKGGTLYWPMGRHDAQRSGGMTERPVILTSAISAAVLQPFSQSLKIVKGVAPFRWQVAAGALPPGLVLDPGTGLVSGVAQQTGTFSATVTVRDAIRGSASKEITFSVNVMAIETLSLPQGQPGSWYSQALSVAGGTAPMAWSVIAGSLPAGLALDPATGVISGYPAAEGTFSFTLRVGDGSGNQAIKTLQLTLLPWEPLDEPYTGGADAVAVDKDGNLYVSANLYSLGHRLIKYGPDGKKLWSKTYSGEVLRGIRLDQSGNIYLAGFNNFSAPQAFAIKFDPAGNQLWSRIYDHGYPNGMVVDASGALYLAGSPQQWSGSDGWMLKYDTDGTLLWSRTAFTDDLPRGLALDARGNVYLSCYFNRVLKIDPSGNTLWTRRYGSKILNISGIAVDRDDNVTVVSADTLWKYGPSGTLLWSAGSNGISIMGFTTDGSGNSYVTGSIWHGDTTSAATTRYDSSGKMVWTRTFESGYSDWAEAVAIDEATNVVYVAGSRNDAQGIRYPITYRYEQPRIITAALPEARLNGPWSGSFTAERGRGPYTWSLMAGALPPGLSLDTSGAVSGRPSAAGTYSFAVTVTGSDAVSDTRSYTLTVTGSIEETDFFATPLTGQAPLVVNFTDASTNNPFAWNWSLGDGAQSAERNSTHVYTVPGTYSVTLSTLGPGGSGTRTKTGYITVLGCSNGPVSLSSASLTSFSDLDGAYRQALDKDLILLQAQDFFNDLIISRNIRVSLKGGYDCGYVKNNGQAALHGKVRLLDGTLNVENLLLK